MFSLAWEPALLGASLIPALVAVGYLLYHHGLELPAAARLLRLADVPPGAPRRVFTQRLLGLLTVGLLPALAAWAALGLSLDELGLGAGSPRRALLAVLPAAAAVLPVVWLGARRPALWRYYPQVRVERWDRPLFLASALSWSLYLLGYELCFRGLLLFALARALGAWPALALTTLAYAFAHLPKNAAECWGSLLMGVVFGLLALWTGAIWAPLVLHALIAVGSDAWVIRANPALRWAAGGR